MTGSNNGAIDFLKKNQPPKWDVEVSDEDHTITITIVTSGENPDGTRWDGKEPEEYWAKLKHTTD